MTGMIHSHYPNLLKQRAKENVRYSGFVTLVECDSLSKNHRAFVQLTLIVAY